MANIAGSGGGSRYGRRPAPRPNDVPPGNALLAKFQAAQQRQDAGLNPGFDPTHAAATAVHALLHGTASPAERQRAAQQKVIGGPVFNPVTLVVDALLHAPSQARAAHELAVKVSQPDKYPPSLGQNVNALLTGSFGVPLMRLKKDGTPAPIIPRVPKGATTPGTGGELGQQVREGLRGAAATRTQQEKLYSAERSTRIAEAERIMNEVGGEEGHRLALKALSGELPKLEFNGFSELSRDNVPALFQHIQEHPVLRPYEKVRARTALLNLFDGRVPTRSELRLLETTFGREDSLKLAASVDLWRKLGNTGLQLLAVPRALKSAFDLSAPFRQGLVLGARHPRMFAGEFRPMLKSFRSESAYMDVMDEIASRPTFAAMQNAKLALTDLEHISNREEAFASNLAEYVPGVRASGRAYVAFLNKFRADAFDNYLRLAESQGRDPTDPALLQGIARWVNNATGRGGSSKFIASHAVGLNATFFSPRLIASRLNLLINPVFYAKLDPFARKQALRGMAQLIGAISLTLWLAKLNGAQVGIDPRSADFGKIKTGNTRVDVMGGFQQYIVAADRLITGETVSSTTGAVEHLTGGFGKSSRGTLLTRLAQQKFAPVPAYAWGWLNNENFAGRPFDPLKEAGLLVAPLGPQNAVDTYRQEGIGPALAGLGLGSVGFGVQTYGPKSAPAAGSRSGGYGSSSISGGSRYGRRSSSGGSRYGRRR